MPAENDAAQDTNDTEVVDDQTQGGVEGDSVDQSLEQQDVRSGDATAGDGGTESAVANAPEGSDSEAGDDAAGEVNLDEQVEAWRQHLEQVGLRDFETMDEAAERMAAKFKEQQDQLREYREQTSFYRQQLSNPGQATSQQPASQQSAEEPSDDTDPIGKLVDGWQDVPAHIVEQYVHVVKDPETGEPRREFLPDTPQAVRDSVQEFANRMGQWQEVLSDPRKLIPAIEQRVQKLINEQLDTGLSKREQEMTDKQAMSQFLENSPWLYQTDPLTKQVAVDDITGQKLLSREGQEFAGLLEQAKEEIQNPTMARRLKWAEREWQLNRAQRQQAPLVKREQAAATNQEKRQQMRARTNANPAKPNEVNGVSPRLGRDVTGQENMSYGEMVLEHMKST